MQRAMNKTEKRLYKLLFGVVISATFAGYVLDGAMPGWIIVAYFIVVFPLASYLVFRGWMRFFDLGKK
jgi:hypothetical protein